MIRVDRSELTKKEIIRVAANCFLRDGYSKTTFRSMSHALNMSTGNMTFHFHTKEHMLEELVNMLCKFQWLMMEREADEGTDSVGAICLELLTMASACEEDEIMKDFFLAAYTSPLCMEIIRKNDKERSKRVYGAYCPDWSEEEFSKAEILVSGIEYATLMTTDSSVPLVPRVTAALELIFRLYNVPKDVQARQIAGALSSDYQTLSISLPEEFKAFVDHETEQALHDLLTRKPSAGAAEQ